jgi:cytochrome c
MTHVLLRMLAPSLVALAFVTAAKAETSDAKMAFNNACRTCHSMREGDHRLGPSLNGVVGRKAGSVEGYQFSSAMQQSGIVWDAKTLDAFIANPDKVVHGNAMKPFGGIDDAQQRGEIVAYLKSISK